MKEHRKRLIHGITLFTIFVLLIAGAVYLLRFLTRNGFLDSSYDVTQEGQTNPPRKESATEKGDALSGGSPSNGAPADGSSPDSGSSDSGPAGDGSDTAPATDGSPAGSGPSGDTPATAPATDGSDVSPDESVSEAVSESISETTPGRTEVPGGPAVPGGDSEDVSQAKERVIDPARPMVALTFDDGPGRGTTAILDLLEQYDARATFFIIGLRLESEVQVEKMQRAYEMGCVIGSHTYDHISFKKLKKNAIQDQLDRTNELLVRYLGVPAPLVRPPYGHVTDAAREVADTPFIYWSIDTEDWLSRDADEVIEIVQENVQDGDIILMHDLYPSTAEACETLIPWLLDQGYQLVTVPELMEAKGIEMENGVMYKDGR